MPQCDTKSLALFSIASWGTRWCASMFGGNEPSSAGSSSVPVEMTTCQARPAKAGHACLEERPLVLVVQRAQGHKEDRIVTGRLPLPLERPVSQAWPDKRKPLIEGVSGDLELSGKICDGQRLWLQEQVVGHRHVQAV